MTLTLTGSFSTLLVNGDIEIRLTNSDTANLATDIQGIDVSNNAHSIVVLFSLVIIII